MISIKNLGYRTDCIFHEHNGVVEEKFDYYVIRTPSNPSFWFGNFVLFKHSPREGDFLAWTDIYRLEFGDHLEHVTFGWDEDTQGAVAEFKDNGFTLVNDVVLRMSEYTAITRINRDIEIRKIVEECEWNAVTELQINVDLEYWGRRDEGGAFRGAQTIAYRCMS